MDVARDVEGVALAVAEAVDHRAAHAALLAHRLSQRLCLAPVAAQVLALRHHQGLAAGGQHLGFAHGLQHGRGVRVRVRVRLGLGLGLEAVVLQLVRGGDGALGATGLLGVGRGAAQAPHQ